jgi:hypothetical protein
VTTTRGRPLAVRFAAADPAGLLYGAIVSAATLTTVSLHTPEAAFVALGTSAVLVIYWMADLYVHALTVRFEGDTRGLLRRLGQAAGHKSSVLKGGLPSIVVYVVVYVAGAGASVAAFVALGTAVVLLTCAGYVGARHAGTARRPAMVEAAGAGSLGLVMVAAKTLLH